MISNWHRKRTSQIDPHERWTKGRIGKDQTDSDWTTAITKVRDSNWARPSTTKIAEGRTELTISSGAEDRKERERERERERTGRKIERERKIDCLTW